MKCERFIILRGKIFRLLVLPITHPLNRIFYNRWRKVSLTFAFLNSLQREAQPFEYLRQFSIDKVSVTNNHSYRTRKDISSTLVI